MSPLLNLRPVLGDMPLSVTCGARPSLTVADAGRPGVVSFLSGQCLQGTRDDTAALCSSELRHQFPHPSGGQPSRPLGASLPLLLGGKGIPSAPFFPPVVY